MLRRGRLSRLRRLGGVPLCRWWRARAPTAPSAASGSRVRRTTWKCTFLGASTARTPGLRARHDAKSFEMEAGRREPSGQPANRASQAQAPQACVGAAQANDGAPATRAHGKLARTCRSRAFCALFLVAGATPQSKGAKPPGIVVALPHPPQLAMRQLSSAPC